HTSPCRPLRQNLLDIVILDETLHHQAFRATGRQNIEITHGLLGAAIATGDHHFVDAGNRVQVIEQRCRVLIGGNAGIAPHSATVSLQSVSDVHFGLLAEPWKRPDSMLTYRAPQLLEGLNTEFAVQHSYPL